MNNFHSIGGIKMNKNIDFVNGNTKKCLLEMTVPKICASGIPNKIGECVTIINCDPSFAHEYISISNVNCL